MNSTKILKNRLFSRRISKLSVFEYFGLVETKTKAAPMECVANELLAFLDSEIFTSEFKHSLKSQESVFLFFALNLRIVLETAKIKNKMQFKRKEYANFLESKAILLGKDFLLSYWGRNILAEFAKRDQIEGKYNFVIEEAEVKRLSLLESLKIKEIKTLVKEIKENKEDSAVLKGFLSKKTVF